MDALKAEKSMAEGCRVVNGIPNQHRLLLMF